MDTSQSSIGSGFKFSMAGGPKFLIIIIVVIIAVTAGGYWYWSKSKQTSQEAPTLGSEIFEKTQNPLGGKLPDINPFVDQPNPFGDKTNPIEKAYTNPF